MQTILHPTHRIIVRRLLDHVFSGKHLKITQQDINDFKQLLHGTKIADVRKKTLLIEH